MKYHSLNNTTTRDIVTKPIVFKDLIHNPQLFLYRILINLGVVEIASASKEDFKYNCKLSGKQRYLLNLQELISKSNQLSLESKPMHFLFMTDFCGSTLFAKSLMALQGLFVFLEPRIFAELSVYKRGNDFHGKPYIKLWEQSLEVALHLMSRQFQEGEVILSKEWPPTNYIMGDLLSTNKMSRGIFLYGSLEDYLNAVFRHPGRRKFTRKRVLKILKETKLFEPLNSIDKAGLDDGNIAVVHWLTQMYLYLRTIEEYPEVKLCSIASVDFYKDPAFVITKAANFLRCAIPYEQAMDVTLGPLFKTHSKNSKLQYTEKDRIKDINNTRQKYAKEIRRSILWANELMQISPVPELLPRSLLQQNTEL